MRDPDQECSGDDTPHHLDFIVLDVAENRFHVMAEIVAGKTETGRPHGGADNIQNREDGMQENEQACSG
jgi:hypothetical protein